MNTMFPAEDDKLYFDRNMNDLLNERLKTALVSGYSKSSVAQFVEELYRSSEQMKVGLEKQIQNLLSEKATLSQECVLLRNQLKEVENNHSHQKTESEEFLKAGREETEKIKAQLLQLKSENEALNKKLAQQQNGQETILLLEKKLAEKERKLAEKESELEKLSAQLSENVVRCKTLEEQVGILSRQKAEEAERSENPVKEEYIARMSSEIETLRKRESKLNERIADERQKADSAEKTAKETEAKLKLLQSQLSDESERLQKNEDELNEKVAAHLQRAAVAEKTAGESVKKLELLQTKLKQEQDRVTELEEQLQHHQNESVELERKYDLLYRNYSSAVQKNSTLSAEKDAISGLLQKHQKKEQEYALLQKQNEEYRSTILSFDEAIKLILQEMENQMKLFQDTVTQYHKEEVQVHGLVQEKTQLQIKNVDLLDQISILTANLLKTEQECERLMRLLRFSRNESEVSQEDLPEGSQGNSNFAKEIQKLGLAANVKEDTNELVDNAVQRAKEISKIYCIDKKSEIHSSIG